MVRFLSSRAQLGSWYVEYYYEEHRFRKTYSYPDPIYGWQFDYPINIRVKFYNRMNHSL